MNKEQQIQKIDGELQTYLHYLNSEQKEYLLLIIKTFTKGMVGTRDLIKLSDIDGDKVDTALPIDYVRRIEEILPDFKTYYNCINYESGWGKMDNIAEAIILKLHKTFEI